MTWALSITEKANQITGLNVGLYSVMFSPEFGTLAWSTFVPDLATLEAANDKLLADDGYISLVDDGAKFSASGVDDALVQIVSGEVDPSREVNYATIVQTTCMSGSLMRGIEVGVEIAQRAETILGTPVLFGSSATGNYGQVGWFSGYADVQSLEQSQQALSADLKFGEYIDDSVRGVYTDDPNQSQQTIWRRVA
jgi:hypothetical protein